MSSMWKKNGGFLEIGSKCKIEIKLSDTGGRL